MERQTRKEGAAGATGGLGKIGTTVKEGVVMSLKGINEIEAEIVSLARNTVSSALRATGDIAGEGINITKDV